MFLRGFCKLETLEKVIDVEKLKDKKYYFAAKRIQDIILSSLALIVLSPLMLIVSLIIIIDSPGASPFFVQERVGKDGKIFRLYKFRSMCPNAEEKLPQISDKNEMDGPVFKIRDDPRITRFGKFIRKMSIDELLQLVNIVKGDMTIVGPRPALVNEVAEYTDYEKQRLVVKPGLSCYWQIQDDRNSVCFDDWMKLDIKYISEMNFLLDWKIIFETIVVAFKGEGI